MRDGNYWNTSNDSDNGYEIGNNDFNKHLGNRECYVNRTGQIIGGEDGMPSCMPNVDKRAEIGRKYMAEEITKAPSMEVTVTGGAGTAGYALTPIFVDPTIVDQTRKMTPLVEIIPRRASKGNTFDFNLLSAKGGASWKLEDASLAGDVDTYSRSSTVIKYGYSIGRVTGPMMASARHYMDAMAQDISVKVAALKELEEDTIINGDVSTYVTEYNGLINGISTNTLAAGNGTGSVNITLADIRIEEAVCFNARGQVSLAVTDATTHNYIKGLLMDYQRNVDVPTEGMGFGIPGSFVYNGITFIRDIFMPTGANSKICLLLDMRYIFMAVLQDYTYEELAKVNDSNKYMIKVYEALILTYEGSSAQITTIA